MKQIIIAASMLVLGATSIAASASFSPNLIGEPAKATPFGRTIVINSDTKWANVMQGETIKFVANGHEFSVTFNGVAAPVDLQQLAPAGALDHKVQVYVASNVAG
jgi:Heavy-metal resistance protein CzcE